MPLKKSDNLWIELDTVDSTNNYAMRLVHEGLAQHGLVVRTKQQTAGKGQRGRNWTTEQDKNLLFSIIVQPTFLLASQGFQLLATTAVAIREQLEKRIGEETKIKWPNDLYWRDRKTGGILIENVFRGTQWQWAVIGIGINVNQTAFTDLKNAVSIQQITGVETVIPDLANEIYQALMQAISLLETNGFEQPFASYNQQLYKLGETVKLKQGSRLFETPIQGVNLQGQLLTGPDSNACFEFGEVEWML